MQRTIYDFLYRKYGFSAPGENKAFRSLFSAGMRAYWGVKLLAVGLFFFLFLRFTGKDRFIPEDTYWFIGSIAAALILVTLSYLNVFGAWYAIALSRHRRWIDSLLILSGLVLCIRFPVYAFGEAMPDVSELRESLILPGILMLMLGIYRKIHYRSSGVVPLSALASLLITAGILYKYPIHTITQSIYLSFIMLINAGFVADLLLFHYWHRKSKAGER
jgi:hypothetical protein